MIVLHSATPAAWIEIVLADFDNFLIDHAAAEKKASGMAISMLSHYPDKPDIVRAMTDLAVEEMMHFREVVKLLLERGLQLGADTKDSYVNNLRKLARKESQDYLMDRLLLGGIIEARGCERFGLLADALPQGQMKDFYSAISESESRHQSLFYQLAGNYFERQPLRQRLHTLLEQEAAILANLPFTPALH